MVSNAYRGAGEEMKKKKKRLSVHSSCEHIRDENLMAEVVGVYDQNSHTVSEEKYRWHTEEPARK